MPKQVVSIALRERMGLMVVINIVVLVTVENIWMKLGAAQQIANHVQEENIFQAVLHQTAVLTVQRESMVYRLIVLRVRREDIRQLGHYLVKIVQMENIFQAVLHQASVPPVRWESMVKTVDVTIANLVEYRQLQIHGVTIVTLENKQ